MIRTFPKKKKKVALFVPNRPQNNLHSNRDYKNQSAGNRCKTATEKIANTDAMI